MEAPHGFLIDPEEALRRALLGDLVLQVPDAVLDISDSDLVPNLERFTVATPSFDGCLLLGILPLLDEDTPFHQVTAIIQARKIESGATSVESLKVGSCSRDGRLYAV